MNKAIINLAFKYISKVGWKLPDSGWNGNIRFITTKEKAQIHPTGHQTYKPGKSMARAAGCS